MACLSSANASRQGTFGRGSFGGAAFAPAAAVAPSPSDKEMKAIIEKEKTHSSKLKTMNIPKFSNIRVEIPIYQGKPRRIFIVKRRDENFSVFFLLR